jgi:hypothetical protein
MPPGMVGHLPFGVDDRPLPHLDDAIAGAKAAGDRRFDDLQMRPLVTVIVDVIRNLAQQDTFRPLDRV